MRNSLQPLCALWRRDPCLRAAEELLAGPRAVGPRAILPLVRAVRLDWAEIGPFRDADTPELLRWLHTFKQAPKSTYLVHGEPAAASLMQAAITKEFRPVVLNAKANWRSLNSTSSMMASGVEVPAVMPTVSAVTSHSGRKSAAPCT